MKQIPLTPDLINKIKAAVGEDVDPSNFAVFETIALNTLPLLGKSGTIFEGAEISYLTLKQMSDSINVGNHLPLIQNHEMSDTPVGRVFYAEVLLNELGSAELRALFYLDPTEETLISKLNAGSLDEVSVQFLASQILCSECSFDYRGEEASWQNFDTRTCSNGHTIGENGVHARLVGLSVFTELSLVTRGAANKPKIVGKSQSKLAAPLQALAARGFEVDQLCLTASKGETEVNLDSLVTQLTEKTTEAATLAVTLSTVTQERDALKVKLESAEAHASDVDTTDKVALVAARAWMVSLFTKLATAAGETDVVVPDTLTELTVGIDKHQSTLTALLPVGGVSQKGVESEVGAKFSANRLGAFKTNL